MILLVVSVLVLLVAAYLVSTNGAKDIDALRGEIKTLHNINKIFDQSINKQKNEIIVLNEKLADIEGRITNVLNKIEWLAMKEQNARQSNKLILSVDPELKAIPINLSLRRKKKKLLTSAQTQEAIVKKIHQTKEYNGAWTDTD